MNRRPRIGELAERTGVRPDLLRAWERRYGLLRPTRSDAGYRLYSYEDEERVRAMVRQRGTGAPAGEAARLVLERVGVPDPPTPTLPAASAELARDTRLLFAGAGAREDVAAAIGAALLRGDPVEAAADLAGRPA